MNDIEIKTYRLIIKGKVQNVGFRHWFSDLAISLGLNGYVQNLNNKDEVEAIVQGNIKDILNITEKSKNGPQMSLVEGVIPNQIISNVKYSGFIVNTIVIKLYKSFFYSLMKTIKHFINLIFSYNKLRT